MNGQLRNAIAHESYTIENNYILWIQDSNKQKQYSLKKIFDKIFDLYALLIALYWGYCNVYAPHAIKGYNQTPDKKLKNSFILLRKYNLELYLTATERTEYTEGMLLRSLCHLCTLWQKVTKNRCCLV